MVRIFLTTATTATLLLAPAGGVALAAEGPESADTQSASAAAPKTSQIAEIARQFTNTETLSSQAGSSPSYSTQAFPTTGAFVGCYGKTDDPHKSYSFALAHARTVCPSASKATSTNLARHRWWGWEHLANGGSTGYSDAVTKWYCRGTGTYTYQGTTFHRATIGGRVATAYTANSEQFSC
ncbi:MAG: hypothetical protein ACK5MP_07160 [Nostocoides sp.]